ncbi:aminoglycoside phosphotransferase family protein [Streptomyces sp. NPDC089919]|uniref:phosphotransferase family protein n=1 Tax=Streptomyces sp. NPDC089919 TaxID=3155188 RepID=UPI0034216346
MGDDEQEWRATRAWVERGLAPGERITAAERLRGGVTSEMRRLEVMGPPALMSPPDGAGPPDLGVSGARSLVLRSFVKPFYRRHAEGLLNREADVLRLLAQAEGIPAARLVAVDATAAHCDDPSLLMTLLPGSVRITEEGAGARAGLLARQLVRIHGLAVAEADRPRVYEAWTTPERVTVPPSTRRPELWARAVDVIRQPPPRYEPRFLHRDFHPGNVLFAGTGPSLRITGVVDWVETSWGPADLDVAHCATGLTLLHGVAAGMAFADRYEAAGGVLATGPDHLYWRLLDVLAFAPNAEKVGVPWRALGRPDLTPPLLTSRLESYVSTLMTRYG